MINTPKEVIGETGAGRILFIAAAEGTNALFGFPFDPFQTLAAAILFEIGARLAGYTFGWGSARASLAVAENYGRTVAQEVQQDG